MRYLLILSLASCAPFVHEHGAVPAPVPLARATDSPGTAAALATFYGATLAPDAQARLERALKTDPDSGALHEALAYLYELHADAMGYSTHLLAAARDVTDPFTAIYLHELANALLTTEQRDIYMGTLLSLARHHPNHEIQADAAEALALERAQLGDIAGTAELLDPLAFFEHWQVIGAFDNDEGKGFLTAYPPEQGIDLTATYPGVRRPTHWREVPVLTHQRAVALSDLVYPERSVAYLATFVFSDEVQAARIHLDSDEPLAAWVNDGAVLSEPLLPGGRRSKLVADIALAKGWNKLLIKSAARADRWFIRARLSKPDGTPLALRTTAKPQLYIAQTSTPVPLVVAPPELAALTPEVRRLSLLIRYQARAGLREQALDSAKRLLTIAPEHPLVAVQGALAFWSKDEAERVVDLLATTQPELVALQRARWHRQKKFWDETRADIDAVLAQPRDQRWARIEEVELYAARGQPLERCRVFADLVARWPDWPWALSERASCVHNRGFLEEAEALRERVQQLLPGQVSALAALAERARAVGDLPKALALAERMHELEPWSVAHLLFLADLHRRDGDTQAAQATLRAAVALDPDAPAPYERMGDLLYEARNDKAFAFYRQALERAPEDSALAERVAPQTQGGIIARYMPSAADIAGAIKSAPTTERLPGASTLVLLDDDVTEIGDDGSTHSVETLVQQALDERGRDDLTQQHLATGSREHLRAAYALTPTGEKQEAASVTRTVVRFRQLAVGSIVVTQHEWWTPPGSFLHNHAAEGFSFQLVNAQNVKSRWVLASRRPLSVHLRGDVKRVDSESEGMHVTIFSAAQVPALQAEPRMPPANTQLWSADFSTVPSWDEFVRWERAMLSEAYRSGPEIEGLAKKVTQGASDPAAKLQALFSYVAQKIRYQQDYETNIAGVKPHACPVVIERGYGDCKDKALLLMALAHTVGIELRFALVRTRSAGDVQKEVPNQQFNHAIVYQPAQTGLPTARFWDPTAEDLDEKNLSADDQGSLSLVFAVESDSPAEFIPIPLRPPAEEGMVVDSTLTLDTKGAHVETQIEAHGGFGMALRRAMREKKAAEKVYQSLSSAMYPGATLGETRSEHLSDIAGHATVHFALDIASAVESEETHQRVKLPNLLRLREWIGLEQRKLPLRLGVLEEAHFVNHVKLDAGVKALRMPRDFAVKNACFNASRTLTKHGAELTFTTSFVRTCADVPAQDYPQFRKDVEQVAQAIEDPLAFSR